MSLPNFIIIGAPKAGSTSLYHYVGQHPDVFTSRVKEPRFFWTHRTSAHTETLDEYEKLFQGSERFQAVGEGSPAYLADENTPRLIKDLIPDVKLIAILRDPYERAFSQFVFLRLRKTEREATFLAAIEADEALDLAQKVGYVENSLYHRNLSRYLSVFSPEQIKVVLLEDLQERPPEVMKEVFSFLDVDPSVDVDTSEKLTQSGVPHLSAMHWFLSDRNPIKRLLGPLVPKAAKKIIRRIRTANLRKQTLSMADRRALAPYFDDDVEQLETLLNRDLSHWLAGSTRHPSQGEPNRRNS